jgi:hypothetical protein
MQPIKGELEDDIDSDGVGGSIEFRDPITN